MNRSPGVSYWEADTWLASCDILVVGAGIVGTQAAIHLKEQRPGLEVCLVDRGVFPLGASTRNAGFACFGSPTEIIADHENMGEEAFHLVEQRKRGLDLLFQRVSPAQCGYEPVGGAEVFTDQDEKAFARCAEELDSLNAELRPVFDGDPFLIAHDRIQSNGLKNIRHLISLPYEGQLHPAKMLHALHGVARDMGVRIISGLEITAFHEETKSLIVETSRGWRLQAEYLLITTNGFARELLPDVEVIPTRNQVLVSGKLPLQLRGCFHYHQGYVYFRNVGDRLLIGGARHLDTRGEETSEFGMTEQITSWLQDFVKKHIISGDFKTDFAWSGIMGLGTEKRPVIRVTGQRTVAAVRLGGMGIAIGTVVGQEAADLLIERL